MKKFYLLVVEGGLDPALYGCFDSAEERDSDAQVRYGEADEDSAIIALDIEDNVPEFRPYPSSFFCGNVDEPGSVVYEYFINLDERGEFHADVRDVQGKTIFEIHEPREYAMSFFELGWMKHKFDLDGLRGYLVDNAFIRSDAKLIRGS